MRSADINPDQIVDWNPPSHKEGVRIHVGDNPSASVEKFSTTVSLERLELTLLCVDR